MSAGAHAQVNFGLPNDMEVEQALESFAKDVCEHYGTSLHGIYLFGSRARGEHDQESDADVAVVLSGDFEFWREAGVLSGLAFDYLVENGVFIDVKPLSLEAWKDPSSHANAPLVRAVRRDCKVIGIAA